MAVRPSTFAALLGIHLGSYLADASSHSPPPPPSPSPPACSSEYSECITSGCCIDEDFGCYKKPHEHHAECLPHSRSRSEGHANDQLDQQGEADCVDTKDWKCPGWEQCGAPYGECTDSGCCYAGFGCYKRPFSEFAQCRPLNDEEPCVDNDEWLCPGWNTCTAPHGDCSQSRCCEHHNDACWKRPFSNYAECRPKPSEDNECRDTDEWLCPGWERCSDPDSGCTTTGCCNHELFTCYMLHEHYGHCMRTGTCEAQIEAKLPGQDWSHVSDVACVEAELYAGTEESEEEWLLHAERSSTTSQIWAQRQFKLNEELVAVQELEAELQHTAEELQLSGVGLLEIILLMTLLGVLFGGGLSAFCLWYRQPPKERRYSSFIDLKEASGDSAPPQMVVVNDALENDGGAEPPASPDVAAADCSASKEGDIQMCASTAVAKLNDSDDATSPTVTPSSESMARSIVDRAAV